MNMTGGEKIRELRKANRLTLRQLAKQLEINFTYLSKIENMTTDEDGNKTIPSTKLIIKIAESLGVHPDDILQYYDKILTKVDDWAQSKAFKEFYRSVSDKDITSDEWKKLAEYLKREKNKRAHDND